MLKIGSEKSIKQLLHPPETKGSQTKNKLKLEILPFWQISHFYLNSFALIQNLNISPFFLAYN